MSAFEEEIRRQADELRRQVEREIYGQQGFAGGGLGGYGQQQRETKRERPPLPKLIEFVQSAAGLAAIARVIPPLARAQPMYWIVVGVNGDVRVLGTPRVKADDVHVGFLHVLRGRTHVFHFEPVPVS